MAETSEGRMEAADEAARAADEARASDAATVVARPAEDPVAVEGVEAAAADEPPAVVEPPRREAIAAFGNRCVVWSGRDVMARLGSDLAQQVGRPRLAVLVSEAGTDAELTLLLRRDLVDRGFAVAELGVERESATLRCAQGLLEGLATLGPTADDALIAIGGAEALAVASWAASQWRDGIASACVATDLEAGLTIPATPRALAVGEAAGVLTVRPGFQLAYLDPVALALDDGPHTLAAKALLAQTAMVESERAFGELCAASEAIAADEGGALVAQVVEGSHRRARVATAIAPGVRQGLALGRDLAEGLGLLLGPEAPYGRALAEGLRFSARVAWQVAGLSEDIVFAQDALLARLGLTELAFDLEPEALLAAVREAALRRSNRFLPCLPQAPGRVRPTPVADEVLLEHLGALCHQRRLLRH